MILTYIGMALLVSIIVGIAVGQMSQNKDDGQPGRPTTPSPNHPAGRAQKTLQQPDDRPLSPWEAQRFEQIQQGWPKTGKQRNAT